VNDFTRMTSSPIIPLNEVATTTCRFRRLGSRVMYDLYGGAPLVTGLSLRDFRPDAIKPHRNIFAAAEAIGKTQTNVDVLSGR